MIAINGSSISKSYGAPQTKQPVLRNVSLSVPQGAVAVITGRSGSGKSTLLNILAGLDTPDTGSVNVCGTEIGGKDQEFLARFRLKNIGLIFQFFNFLPTLSLRENVALPAYLAGEKKRLASARAETLLAQVGVESQMLRLPQEVSGGELQRAAIARALINQASVILADEPTGNLDQTNAEVVMEVLIQLTREHGTTLLIVSHDPLIEQRATHLFRLQDGELVA